MAFEHTLLERIDRAGESQNRSLTLNLEKMADSILQHLQQMLNVHQGSVTALPTYGLPDFNDLVVQFPEAILEIQKAIKNSIEQYEPRLKKVRIKYIPDEENPINLRFEITAQLVTDEGDASLWFETFLDTAGRISVRG